MTSLAEVVDSAVKHLEGLEGRAQALTARVLALEGELAAERRRRASAEAELQAARDVLGEAWLFDGASLAQGIRRKCRVLEETT